MISIDPSVPPMSVVAMEACLEAGTSLLVAYIASGDPDRVALIRFAHMRDWHLGYPNDEAIEAHPLHGHGLELYAFHVTGTNSFGERCWIATFKEQTLTVYARWVNVLSVEPGADPAATLRRSQTPRE